MKISRVDLMLFALIIPFAVLARPVLKTVSIDGAASGGSIAVVSIYAVAAIAVGCAVIWSLSRGATTLHDWGLSTKYLLPILLFLGIVIVIGFLINSAPVDHWGADVLRLTVILINDVVLMALTLTLLTRYASESLRKLRIPLVSALNAGLLLPGLPLRECITGVILIVVGVWLLDRHGTVLWSAILTFPYLIRNFRAENGAVVLLTLVVLYLLLTSFAYMASRIGTRYGFNGRRVNTQ